MLLNHIPERIKCLVCNLYTGFKISLITHNFTTPFITIGCGVLKGDCLSALLCNLCFNTFIQHIKSDENHQCGFFNKNVINGTLLSLQPIHWFQLADDTAEVSGQENENQLLLNRFTLWCQWADRIIRVGKCVTFGMKKVRTKSVQHQPKLVINSQLVPCVTTGSSFKYLGRYFDFQMSNYMHKSGLIDMTNTILAPTDQLPLHPK